MADEQYKWLNRATAERLLRGESLEAVDPAARDQAERLGKALGALFAQTAPATVELPGEEAALAAFRKARESAEDERTAMAAQWGRPGRSADAGLVRIGAGSVPLRVSRWARPARFGLAAALAAGMLGGVAVAAGTGVLPTPFGGNRPGPAASVSAAGTPGVPQGSASPESLLGGETGTPTSGTTSDGSGQPSPDPSGRSKEKGTGSNGGTGNAWGRALASCRAVQHGKSLGADRRRALEGLAGGAGRVDKFCRTVLGAGKGGSYGDGKGSVGGQGGNDGWSGGQGDGNGQGGDGRSGSGSGSGSGSDEGNGGGNDHHEDGTASPAPTGFAPLLPSRSAATPDPTYSAL